MLKTSIVNKVYEEIDEYVMLDGGTGGVFTVDPLGAVQHVAVGFEEKVP